MTLAAINATVLSVLLCPSDPGGPKIPPAGQGQGFHANYALCHGNRSAVVVAVSAPGRDRFGLANNGIFYGRSKTRLADIQDGTTNTVAASEILVSNPGNSDPDMRGRIWNAVHNGATFSTIFPPNSTIGDYPQGRRCIALPRTPCAASNSNGVYILARSIHTGGVNVAMTDGSVRFIPNTISPIAWLDMGTRAGGEIPSGD